MWGLFALEDIKSGAYITEYVGEIISKKEGDIRGANYDYKGMNYLFDMQDPETLDDELLKSDEFFQKYERIFPLCVDAFEFGNEARFINHSCDPNTQVMNVANELEINSYHHLYIYASRKIKKGEEITIDYKWDQYPLDIQDDIPCMCGTHKCRGWLMKSKNPKLHDS